MTQEVLSISVEGLGTTEARISGLAERMKDWTPVWRYAHKAFMLEEGEQFKTQGAHMLGQQWKPLSPAYAATKPTPPPPYGILYRSGDLLRSLTDPENADHIEVIHPDGAVFGTRVPYGKYHQEGGGNLPQRRFVLVREMFRKLLVRAATLYAMTGHLPESE